MAKGLSVEQIKMLEGAEGIDQSLLAGYKKRNTPTVSLGQESGLSAPSDTVSGKGNDATDVSEGSIVDEISNLEPALNFAIDEARKQRKDMTMDFMGGVVPPGALPASSFASVLNSFNADSAPLESALVKSAVDFQRDKIELQEKKKNDVRDLALSSIQAGASQEVVNSIIALAESGDYDAALKIATPALIKNAPAGKTRSVEGNSIVETDKEGNQSVLYTFTDSAGTEHTVEQSDPNSMSGNQPVGPNGEVSGLFVGRDDSFVQIPYKDYKKGTEEEARAAMAKYIGPEFAQKVADSFGASYTKGFLNDYIEFTTATGAYQDPEEYLRDYAAANSLTIKEKKSTEKKTEESKEEDIYSITGI